MLARTRLTHLQRLEAQSIDIIREATAVPERPDIRLRTRQLGARTRPT